MTQQIVNAYDALHMSDACATAIEDAMKRKASGRKRRQRMRYALAACLTLVLLLVLIDPTPVAKAVNYVKNQIHELISEAGISNVDHTFISDGMMQVNGTNAQGAPVAAGSYDGSAPSCLAERNGKLYFLTEESEIDISDAFSENEPFVHVFYTAKTIQYVAIGGTYTPDTDLEGVCWAVIFRENLENPATYEGWIGGYGRGRTISDSNEFAPWYAKAVEIFEYPFRS